MCLRITHLLKVGLVHTRVTRATSGIEDNTVSKFSETIHPTNSHRKPQKAVLRRFYGSNDSLGILGIFGRYRAAYGF